MKVVIQRVKSASVTVEGQVVSRIGPGILTLLGVAKGDSEAQVERVLKKVIELRIFEDSEGKMNRSLLDVSGEHLIVSQFTLLADTSSGRRPSFILAEAPERARAIYDHALRWSAATGVRTAGGIFQAEMEVALVNDGPVTLVMES